MADRAMYSSRLWISQDFVSQVGGRHPHDGGLTPAWMIVSACRCSWKAPQCIAASATGAKAWWRPAPGARRPARPSFELLQGFLQDGKVRDGFHADRRPPYRHCRQNQL
jgi:hypothetical protein